MILLTIGAVVGGLVWWVVRPEPDSKWEPVVLKWAESPTTRPPGDPYVGAKACAECHPGEYALYTSSGHGRTLRPAGTRLVGRNLDGSMIDDPEQPGVAYAYEHDGERFFIERDGPDDESLRFLVDFALGSGHHATTFVSVTNPDPVQLTLLEHRLTHYHEGDRLGVTPGQAEGLAIPGLVPWGRVLTGSEAVKCLRCHSTRISRYSDKWVDFETLIPNVSCERCHGPGRDHIDAARRGVLDLSMPLGYDRWTSDDLMRACGDCHRHPDKAPPGRLIADDPLLARFQPVGLSQSRCYTESGGALSCITCHDPHARATNDALFYEAECLNCHGRPSQTACTVAPERGCIVCHMPGVDSGQGVLFTDHWIRVRGEPGRSADSPH